MGLAIVGIRVEVQGIHEALTQFRALEIGIQNVVNAAKGLKGVKVPSKLYFAAPGGNIWDNSTTGSFNNTTKNVAQFAAAAATAGPRVAQLTGFTGALMGITCRAKSASCP